MSNHQSAQKEHKQSLARAARNKSQRSKIKTLVKNTLVAISAGEGVHAVECFKKAESEITRAARKGVLKANKAAREVSVLSKKLKTIAS
jgi:small subunit ribosomal protein S20